MEKNKKTIIWLSIFIFLIFAFTIIGTYSFLSVKEYKDGTFNVNISSKGVDVFVFDKGKDASITANVYNFSRGIGHTIDAETYINPRLNTTNNSTQICYEVKVVLPDKQIFQYSPNNTSKEAELVLNVSKSTDGKNYTDVISNMDITTKYGIVKVPISLNGSEYKNIITTTKNKETTQYWKAKLSLIYLPNIDQTVNDEKNYVLTLNANVVEC